MTKQRVTVDGIRLKWAPDEESTSNEWGIQAIATVSYPLAGSPTGNRRLETLTSGGLWGVQPGNSAYLTSIAGDEFEDLILHLAVFGIRPDPADLRELRRRAFAVMVLP